MGRSLFRLPGWGRFTSMVKLALRRVVVITSVWPLTELYHAIYRLHVWYALRTLKEIPATRAIYLTRGVGSGAIAYGVSDIDMVTLGDWTDDQQAAAMKSLRRFSQLSPLFDATLWQHAHTIASMRHLYATDFYYQFRFDQGRGWKLMFGEDVIGTLPPVPADRLAAGYYMDIRNWWGTFLASAFGDGVTARDAVFRHSIAYKTATEVLNKTSSLGRRELKHSRKEGLDLALAEASGRDLEFLQRLKRGAESRHLRFEGDIQDDTLQFLLRNLEGFHARLGQFPPFQPDAGVDMYVDAPADEVLWTTAAKDHALKLVDHVKREWPSYRGAFLVPSISFFTMDDLMLLLEVDPAQPPRADQIRELCRLHAKARTNVPQRVALLLLLPQGAYQLEVVSLMELWHQVICPVANPDVFHLLTRAEFVLDGKPRPPSLIRWTPFAAFLIDEELAVRREAMAKASSDPSMTSIELIRNLFRHLQLEITQRSGLAGCAVVPLTPAAAQRALRAGGAPEMPVGAFVEAYRSEMAGKPVDVTPLIPQLMALFSQQPV